jgi:RNA polymerase subunit RPABC4/transcription elongation factor Spt4
LCQACGHPYPRDEASCPNCKPSRTDI